MRGCTYNCTVYLYLYLYGVSVSAALCIIVACAVRSFFRLPEPKDDGDDVAVLPPTLRHQYPIPQPIAHQPTGSAPVTL